MTAKNRQKSGEKSAAPGQEDAPKKTQKSGGGGGGSGASSGPGPQGPRAASCPGLLATAVFYIAALGAAGFVAFYLQQAVEQISQANARREESARRDAELSGKMESVVQQVESLRSLVDGLESSLGITRVELESAVSRMKRGELETRRVEEALQKLQNDLLRDLSEGIKEVKEARETDFSSLERTVEERLAEVSQSIAANVAEFTEAQGEAQTQLAELKARLGSTGDPALVKREMSAIADAVAEMKTAKEAADATADSLRKQIGAVREELQTRNAEVASLSQEVESVRSVVQETAGGVKEALGAAEAQVEALKDRTVRLQSSVEQVADVVRHAEEKVDTAAAEAQKRSDDLEGRVKASEEGRDSLSASLSDITSRVESLFSKYDAHESSFAAQGAAVERVKNELKQELEVVKGSVGELQSNVALSGAPVGSASEDSSSRRVEDLEKRLAALEDGSRIKPEQAGGSRSASGEQESTEAKLEGHDEAISALQEALRETSQTISGLSDVVSEAQKSNMQDLQSQISALSGAQSELTAKDSSLGQQVEELQSRLAALEENSSRMKPEQLEALRTMVDGLESKAAKLEGHDEAISALQEALQKTTQTLGVLFEDKKEEKSP